MTRILLVVTGASRGLGKAICQAFFEDNADDLVVTRCCLVARSQDGLAATKQSVQEMTTTTPESVSIDTHVVDLGDLDALDTKWEDIMHDLSPTDFDKLILINNAGSIGEIGPMATVKASLKDWQQTINLNVTSLFWTTRVWGQWAISNNLPASLINVSSLVAVQPFPTLSLYSAGKAARDTYYACLAKEITDSPAIRLLSYAPGPLETDMVEEIRAASSLDDTLKPSFATQLLDPLDSARVLVQLVKKDEFSSGTHIDYYDVVQPN